MKQTKLMLWLVCLMLMLAACSPSDGLQNDAGGDRQIVHARQRKEQVMQTDQSNVHHESGYDGLYDTDDRGLFTRMLEVGQTEFVTDIKGNESQRNAGNNIEGLDRGNRAVEAEAEAANDYAAQAVRTDENACNEVGGDVGELQTAKHAGHHKSREHTHGNTK